MVEVHFTFKDKNGGSFVFFCQQSSGLRRTHLWWIPSKFSCQVTILWHWGHAIVISSGLVIPWSLSAFYFFIFFSVCGYIWCDILSPEERPFSLMNNTSPSHPETREQTDCSSRGITGTPFLIWSWQLCPLPGSLAPGTSPLPLSLLRTVFLCHTCLGLLLGTQSWSFLNSTLEAGVFVWSVSFF